MVLTAPPLICLVVFCGVSLSDSPKQISLKDLRSRLYLLTAKFDACANLKVNSSTKKIKEGNAECAGAVKLFKSLPETEQHRCQMIEEPKCRPVGFRRLFRCSVKVKVVGFLGCKWFRFFGGTKTLKSCCQDIIREYSKWNQGCANGQCQKPGTKSTKNGT